MHKSNVLSTSHEYFIANNLNSPSNSTNSQFVRVEINVNPVIYMHTQKKTRNRQKQSHGAQTHLIDKRTHCIQLPGKLVATFIFQTGGNWQTVEMSESISQSLTEPLSSAMLSRVRAVLCDRLFVHLCVCVFQSRQQEGWRNHISRMFSSLKLQVGDVDCNRLWFLRENDVVGNSSAFCDTLLPPTGKNGTNVSQIQAAPVRGDPRNNQGVGWIIKQSTECLSEQETTWEFPSLLEHWRVFLQQLLLSKEKNRNFLFSTRSRLADRSTFSWSRSCAWWSWFKRGAARCRSG